MTEKLSRLQTIYLVFWVVMGTGIIAIPFAIGQFTTRDGWISTAMVLLTGPLTVFVVLLYQRFFPNTNLIPAFSQVFGTVIGKVMALVYVLCLYVTVATVWRELVGFLDVTVYPRTPINVLSAILVVPISYGAYKGIAAIGLFSEFLAPLAGLVVLIFTLFSLNNVHFQAMSPVLIDGWTPILRGAMVPAVTYILEPLVFLQMIEHLASPKTLAWDIAIALAFVFCLLMVIEIVTVGTLGEATRDLRYPVLEVVRSISIANFIERLDTLYGMGVMATIYIKISVFQYAFCSALSDLFGLSGHKVIVWTASILVFTSSVFLFSDAYTIGEFIIFTTPVYFIATFVFMPMLTVLFKAFQKPKQRQPRPSPTSNPSGAV